MKAWNHERGMGLLGVLLVGALTGCPDAPPSRTPVPAASGSVTTPVADAERCAAARRERARVAVLRPAGKLDRTLRVLAAANAACPSEWLASAGDELETLVAIGRTADALELAKRIDASPAADARAREAARGARETIAREASPMPESTAAPAAARTLLAEAESEEAAGRFDAAFSHYLEAWKTWHPNGRALAGAGLMAHALGKNADAQRLFDRAAVELARTSGALAVAAANGLTGELRQITWPGTGALGVLHAGGVTLFSPRTLHAVALLTHKATIRAAAASADGALVVTAADDGSLGLWDGLAATPVRELKAHAGPLNAVAVSAGGALVATASEDKTAALWDGATGREIQRLVGHEAGVDLVALSPDGAFAATASSDKTVRVWDTGTGKELHKLTAHTDAVRELFFSPDGKRLVSASNDWSLRFWDVASGKERIQLKRWPGGSSAFTPDGKLFASRDLGTVVLVDPATGRELRKLRSDDAKEGDTIVATALAFSPDGKLLAVATEDKLRTFASDSGREVRRFDLAGHRTFGLAFAPDGARLAAIGAEPDSKWSVLSIWETATGKLGQSIVGDTNGIHAVRFAPPDNRLALSSSDARVRIWGGGPDAYRALDGAWGKLAFAPDGKLLAAGSASGGLALWDGATGAGVRALAGGGSAQTDVAFTGDGRHVAAADGKAVLLWDVATGSVVRKLEGHTAAVGALAFAPDGKVLASASGDDHTLRLWDVDSGTARTQASGRAYALAYAPDGRRLAVGSDGAVLLWDPSHAGAVLDPKPDDPNAPPARPHHARLRFVEPERAVAFSPDGRLVVSASSQLGAVRIWDGQTGVEREGPAPSTGAVLSVALSPDGSLLATGSSDGALVIRALGDFRTLATLRAVPSIDAVYVYTPDGAIDFAGADAARARDFPLCRFGSVLLPFDVCREHAETPGVLAAVLSAGRAAPEP